MESFSLEKENIIQDIKNLFKLKKELNCTAVKDLRNLFRQKKKLKQLKTEYSKILRIFFEHEEEVESYYKQYE